MVNYPKLIHIFLGCSLVLFIFFRVRPCSFPYWGECHLASFRFFSGDPLIHCMLSIFSGVLWFNRLASSVLLGPGVRGVLGNSDRNSLHHGHLQAEDHQ